MRYSSRRTRFFNSQSARRLLESSPSGVEVSRESPKNLQKSAKISLVRAQHGGAFSWEISGRDSWLRASARPEPCLVSLPVKSPVRSRRALLGPQLGPLLGRLLPMFTDLSDFLGRLQASKTTIQKTPNALRVEESSSPGRVLQQ